MCCNVNMLDVPVRAVTPSATLGTNTQTAKETSDTPQRATCHNFLSATIAGGDFSNGYYSATQEQRATGTQRFLESKLQNCAVPSQWVQL